MHQDLTQTDKNKYCIVLNNLKYLIGTKMAKYI